VRPTAAELEKVLSEQKGGAIVVYKDTDGEISLLADREGKPGGGCNLVILSDFKEPRRKSNPVLAKIKREQRERRKAKADAETQAVNEAYVHPDRSAFARPERDPGPSTSETATRDAPDQPERAPSKPRRLVAPLD
jgi:hypothetical protein